MKLILLLPFFLIHLTSFGQQNNQDSIQQIDLDPVTIISERTSLLPGSGQYIGSQKLTKLNQPNINNILRTIPGVHIRDEEGYGLRPNIGLRGTPANRSAKITLMEDGILIAPATYADPSAYYFPTFARMKGVEVLKGSSQIKYGPYTVGGAVNLLSTTIPTSFKGFAQLSYGSFGSNQQRIWVGDSQKSIDYVFEINRLASKGFKELDNGGNTGFDRRDVMTKIRWHTSVKALIPQSIEMKLASTTEKGNESYLGLTYEDYKVNPIKRYSSTQKDLLDLNHNHISLTHKINPSKNFSIITTAYYSNSFRDWGRVNAVGGQNITTVIGNPTIHKVPYQIMIGKTDGTVDYQSAARTYFSKGIQSNAQYLFFTKSITHKIQMGIRLHADQADRFATRSVYSMTNGNMILNSSGVKGNQENQIRYANSVASYISYDFSFKKIKLSPGIRHENIHVDFKNFGTLDNARLGNSLKSATNEMSILLPGIGINYSINSNTSAFAGLHKGFSPPGMPSITSTLRQAKVETAINYELGYRYKKGHSNLQAIGFLNNYNNILGSDNLSGGGAGSGDMFNAGKAKIVGLELSIEYDLLSHSNSYSGFKVPLQLAYTYTVAKFQDTFKNEGGDWGNGIITKGDLIPFVTPHLLTTSIGIENKNFNATLSARYVGNTRTRPGNKNTIVPSKNVNYNEVNAIGNFLIVDVSSNYMFSKQVTAFATINNLTNQKSIVANLPNGYRPNMPLSFIVGLKVDF